MRSQGLKDNISVSERLYSHASSHKRITNKASDKTAVGQNIGSTSTVPLRSISNKNNDNQHSFMGKTSAAWAHRQHINGVSINKDSFLTFTKKNTTSSTDSFLVSQSKSTMSSCSSFKKPVSFASFSSKKMTSNISSTSSQFSNSKDFSNVITPKDPSLTILKHSADRDVENSPLPHNVNDLNNSNNNNVKPKKVLAEFTSERGISKPNQKYPPPPPAITSNNNNKKSLFSSLTQTTTKITLPTQCTAKPRASSQINRALSSRALPQKTSLTNCKSTSSSSSRARSMTETRQRIARSKTALLGVIDSSNLSSVTSTKNKNRCDYNSNCCKGYYNTNSGVLPKRTQSSGLGNGSFLSNVSITKDSCFFKPSNSTFRVKNISSSSMPMSNNKTDKISKREPASCDKKNELESRFTKVTNEACVVGGKDEKLLSLPSPSNNVCIIASQNYDDVDGEIPLLLPNKKLITDDNSYHLDESQRVTNHTVSCKDSKVNFLKTAFPTLLNTVENGFVADEPPSSLLHNETEFLNDVTLKTDDFQHSNLNSPKSSLQPTSNPIQDFEYLTETESGSTFLTYSAADDNSIANTINNDHNNSPMKKCDKECEVNKDLTYDIIYSKTDNDILKTSKESFKCVSNNNEYDDDITKKTIIHSTTTPATFINANVELTTLPSISTGILDSLPSFRKSLKHDDKLVLSKHSKKLSFSTLPPSNNYPPIKKKSYLKDKHSDLGSWMTTVDSIIGFPTDISKWLDQDFLSSALYSLGQLGLIAAEAATAAAATTTTTGIDYSMVSVTNNATSDIVETNFVINSDDILNMMQQENEKTKEMLSCNKKPSQTQNNQYYSSRPSLPNHNNTGFLKALNKTCVSNEVNQFFFCENNKILKKNEECDKKEKSDEQKKDQYLIQQDSSSSSLIVPCDEIIPLSYSKDKTFYKPKQRFSFSALNTTPSVIVNTDLGYILKNNNNTPGDGLSYNNNTCNRRQSIMSCSSTSATPCAILTNSPAGAISLPFSALQHVFTKTHHNTNERDVSSNTISTTPLLVQPDLSTSNSIITTPSYVGNQSLYNTTIKLPSQIHYSGNTLKNGSSINNTPILPKRGLGERSKWALIRAIRMNSPTMVKQAIRNHGADPNAYFNISSSLVPWTLWDPQANIIQEQQYEYPGPMLYLHPLHLAIACSTPAVVTELIHYGACARAVDSWGRHGLHILLQAPILTKQCRRDDNDVLLSSNNNNYLNKNESCKLLSSVVSAIENSELGQEKITLSNTDITNTDVEVHHNDDDDYVTLTRFLLKHMSSQRSTKAEVLIADILCDAGLDVDFEDQWGRKCLDYLADWMIIRRLIASGKLGNINSKDEQKEQQRSNKQESTTSHNLATAFGSSILDHHVVHIERTATTAESATLTPCITTHTLTNLQEQQQEEEQQEEEQREHGFVVLTPRNNNSPTCQSAVLFTPVPQNSNTLGLPCEREITNALLSTIPQHLIDAVSLLDGRARLEAMASIVGVDIGLNDPRNMVMIRPTRAFHHKRLSTETSSCLPSLMRVISATPQPMNTRQKSEKHLEETKNNNNNANNLMGTPVIKHHEHMMTISTANRITSTAAAGGAAAATISRHSFLSSCCYSMFGSTGQHRHHHHHHHHKLSATASSLCQTSSSLKRSGVSLNHTILQKSGDTTSLYQRKNIVSSGIISRTSLAEVLVELDVENNYNGFSPYKKEFTLYPPLKPGTTRISLKCTPQQSSSYIPTNSSPLKNDYWSFLKEEATVIKTPVHKFSSLINSTPTIQSQYNINIIEASNFFNTTTAATAAPSLTEKIDDLTLPCMNPMTENHDDEELRKFFAFAATNRYHPALSGIWEFLGAEVFPNEKKLFQETNSPTTLQKIC